MEIKFAPEFRKSVKRMYIRQMLAPINPMEWKRKIKWFIQRGRRGYSDADVWNFHSYLSEIIAGGARELKKNHVGVPSMIAGGPFTKPERPIEESSKEWEKILEEIAEGFEATEKLYFSYDIKHGSKEWKALEKKSKLAFKHFEKYYGAMWD